MRIDLKTTHNWGMFIIFWKNRMTNLIFQSGQKYSCAYWLTKKGWPLKLINQFFTLEPRTVQHTNQYFEFIPISENSSLTLLPSHNPKVPRHHIVYKLFFLNKPWGFYLNREQPNHQNPPIISASALVTVKSPSLMSLSLGKWASTCLT